MSRPGYSTGIKGAGIKTLLIPFLHAGPLVTWAAHTLKFRAPESGIVVGVTVNVEAKGGTHSVSTLDVKQGSTSLLAAAFDIFAAVAGTPIDKEGATLATTPTFAKDATLSIVTTESGGTSPTAQGVTVQIDYVPTGD